MNIYQVANEMKIKHQSIYDLDIRVTYYVRVSTLKEEQDSSVDNQISFFENMIAEHSNWHYVKGYVDRVRGESANNRENFMKMIDDGKDGLFDLILTKEVSRFARNTIDSLTYTREMLRSGVGVFFQNDNICTIDSDAEFRLTIMSSIAQDEVRKLSERVKFGHQQAIQKGVVMGNSRIYGYDKDKGKLIINPKEAEMIKMIYELYATGKYSLHNIEDILYNKGYRSRNGRKIAHTTIGNIIKNPKYKGYYCGNKVKITDYRTKEQLFLPESDWVTYKDTTGQIVPQIVDENIWQLAYDKLIQQGMQSRIANRGKKTTSVLSGKIYCAEHNEPFWRTSYSHRLHRDKSIYQWVCKIKKTDKASSCATFPIYEDELYSLLNSFFMSLIDDIDDYINTFMEIYQKYDDTEDTKQQVQAITEQIEKANKKKDKLLELYTEGLIDKQDFKTQNEKINQELDKSKADKDNLLKQQAQNKDIDKQLQQLKTTLKDICTCQQKLSHNEIDICIGLLVDKIYVEAVDKTHMNLNIVIKTDDNSTESHICSYSHISKKMCPVLRISYDRLRGQHISTVNYAISLFIHI